MVADSKGKMRWQAVAPAASEPQDEPPAPTPAPTAPAAPPADSEVARLRNELSQQQQITTLIAQAMMSGKSLNEVLGLAPASQPEADYSNYDLYDDDQRAQFVRQLRQEALATARAEVQAAFQPHQAALANARQQQEYYAVAAKHGQDPDFERKAALTAQLLQGSTNVPFEATYNLVSQIQQFFGAPAAPSKAATPSNGAANQARQTTLTPAQQQQKADQAARLPQSSGVRGAGPPIPPEGLGKGPNGLRETADWVEQQVALGNMQYRNI